MKPSLPLRMLLNLLLLPAVALLAGCATGSASKGASSEAVAAAQPGQPAAAARPLTLWEVSKDGSTSWLFGTCHAGVSLEQALPGSDFDKLKSASRFVMEVDPATMDPAAMQARLVLPEGQKLSAMVDEELWAKLVEDFSLGPAATPKEGDTHPGRAPTPRPLTLISKGRGLGTDALCIERVIGSEL